MSRRRVRSAAYRLRRKFRNYAKGRRASPFVSYVDPKMVELLTAPTLAASLYAGRIHENVLMGQIAQCIGVPERYLTGEGMPEITAAEHEAARRFFDVQANALVEDVVRDCCLTHCDEPHMPECGYGSDADL